MDCTDQVAVGAEYTATTAITGVLVHETPMKSAGKPAAAPPVPPPR
jgi:hypothetical protein